MLSPQPLPAASGATGRRPSRGGEPSMKPLPVPPVLGGTATGADGRSLTGAGADVASTGAGEGVARGSAGRGATGAAPADPPEPDEAEPLPAEPPPAAPDAIGVASGFVGVGEGTGGVGVGVEIPAGVAAGAIAGAAPVAGGVVDFEGLELPAAVSAVAVPWSAEVIVDVEVTASGGVRVGTAVAAGVAPC